MTNNELIKELAVYDGCTYFNLGATSTQGGFSKADTTGYVEYFNYNMLWDYLTDMNILHRIAVNVVNSIRETLDSSDDLDFNLAECNNKIISAMFTSPNPQGEHLQLAEAIVNAIRYISANKAV